MRAKIQLTLLVLTASGGFVLLLSLMSQANAQPLDVDEITLLASPAGITANGLTTTTLTATVKYQGALQHDVPVTFVATIGMFSNWEQTITVTTTDGIAVTWLRSALVSATVTSTVQADAQGAFTETQVAFSAPPCSADLSVWTESAANPVFGQGVDDNEFRAYYPSILYDPDSFSGHGDAAPYKMWYGTKRDGQYGTGYAMSDDGLDWITVSIPLSDINGYHAHVLYDADQFSGHGDAATYKMWYWDVSNSINYATSNNGIDWTDNPGNPVITNSLGLGSAPVYDAFVIHNDDGNPAYYEAWIDNNGKIYYITSADGIAWTGDKQELLADRQNWEASTFSRVSVLKQLGVYHMWYGGADEGGGNHGIGYAVSTDGQNWVKSQDNPILYKDDGPTWRDERTYTPRVLYSATRFDGHGSPEQYKMWFSSIDSALGNYTVGYAALKPLSMSAADTSGSGQSGMAGDALDQPFVVGLRDTCGDPAGSVGITFSMSGAPTDAVGQSLSTLNGTSSDSGQVSSTLTLGSRPGTYTVTAQAQDVLNMPVVFTATASHNLAASISLAPEPHTIVAGSSVTYTVVASDTYGNAWDATGAAAYAIAPGAGGSWGGNVYSGEFAGAWTVSATVDGASGAASLTVLAGAPAGVTLVASPDLLEAGNTATLTATVRDAQANLVPGVNVTFSASADLGLGSLNPLSAATGTAGQATSQVSSTLPGVKTISAEAGLGLTATARVTYTPGAAARVALAVVPHTLVANSGATATVTATGYDAFDNLLVGQPVTFGISHPTLGTVGPDGIGDAAGQVVATWTAGTAIQTGLVSAASGSVSSSAPVTLTFGPPDHLGFAPIADQVAGTPFTITLSAYDAHANVVTSFANVATLTATTATISPTLTGNLLSGMWSDLVEIAVEADDAVITATAGAVSGFSNPFDVIAAEPGWRYVYLPLVVKGLGQLHLYSVGC